MRSLRVLMALGCVIVCGGVTASPPAVAVIDDAGTGVKAEILRVDKAGAESREGITDDRGHFALATRCPSGQRIKAKPNPNFYPGVSECPFSKVTIRVTSVTFFENLKANAGSLEKAGRYGQAALVYNEIHARAAAFDPKIAKDSERKVYELFARQVGSKSTTTFDPEQGRKVISPALHEDIKAFQEEKGLDKTGRLDYLTLRGAADRGVSAYIFERSRRGD